MASVLRHPSPSLFRQPPTLPPSPPLSSISFLQLKVPPLSPRRSAVALAKCAPSGKTEDVEAEPEPASAPPLSSLSWNDATYKWCAGLGGIGFIETAYLTYLKLSDTDAFCPAGGGGSCGDVLNSDYASVFGIPLPLIGMVAYGTVATLGLQLAERKFPFGIGITNGRLVLLGISTSMAAASANFLYILSTKLLGATCTYCLFSALLSFSLFFIILKDFEFEELQKAVVLQLCAATLVFFALNTAYSSVPSIPASLAEANLPYFTTEITTQSSPFAISLARHLRSIGAKMYGAFWCSHCLEQKEMFGKEAAKLLDYVECFPNGYKKGTKIEKACADASIEGFPTWIINGQVLSGEQELPELARISGFVTSEPDQAS